jgi:hypothetical protein
MNLAFRSDVKKMIAAHNNSCRKRINRDDVEWTQLSSK